MITDSTRLSIYDYLTGVFSSVTENLYTMTVPVENTKSDIEDGFAVISVGNTYDESEFECAAYGWVRCQIAAYIPKKTRGRVNKELYESFENSINNAIGINAVGGNSNSYYISNDGVLSIEGSEQTNKGNQFHVFIKSFVVIIDK